MVTEESLERGQLILVGAVAVSLVIIGFVVVLNTTLYAEEVASSSAAEARDSLNGLDQEVFRDSKSVLLRSNHVERYGSRADLSGTVADNFANYSRLLTESYADGGSGFVNVDYVGNRSIYGGRLLQHEEATFTGPGGDPDWNVTARQTEVGWFVMNVNVSNGTDTNFQVNLSNADEGEYARYTLDRDDSNGKLDVSVTSHVDGSTSTVDTTCDPSNERVLVDFVNGSAYRADCSFTSLTEVEPPYNVTITDGDQGKGLYELVVEDPTTLDGPACSGGTPRCLTPVVWQSTISLYYETQMTNYVDEQRLQPYTPDVKPFRGALASGTVVYTRDGEVDHHNQTGATALGPARMNLTGDYRRELPVVVAPGPPSTSRIVLVDRNNVTTTLPTTGNVQTDRSLLAVGTWQGSPRSVFYAGTGGQLFRIAPQTPAGTQQVTTGTVDAEAVAGVGDFDESDDAPELVYLTDDDSIEYLDDGGATFDTSVDAADVNAVGEPADFDGDGNASIPYVTTDGEVALLADAGKTVLTGTSTAAEAPLAPTDVDDDGDLEVVFVSAASNELEYVDDVQSTPTVEQLTDDDGDPVPGDDLTGVVAG